MTDGSAEPAANVRVRGIYATALTRRLLDAGHGVVQASPPIQERFDAELSPESHDVTVVTSDDRQGLNLAGEHKYVEAVQTLFTDVAIDTLSWADPAPEDAVFDGRVVDTLSEGAVVDLGGVEGFLSFYRVDGQIDEGDAVRVQVTDPAVPWDTNRPVLDTGPGFSVSAGLATLTRGSSGIRVEGRDDVAGRELAGMTDLLPLDPPDGWGLEWRRDAREAGMDALSGALERVTERAEKLDSALGTDIEPVRTVATPSAGAWVWFGRESRFALDEIRRDVRATMVGHHRVKAGSSAASAGVDFAEALCGDHLSGSEEFPFGTVTEQFGPRKGDQLRIDHGKPAGQRIVLGRGEVVEYDIDGTVAVERKMSPGGTYDALGVPRESGDTALTKFREGRWWYPTVYRDADGKHKGTYVNICTPVEIFPDAARYVDLEVDVIRYPDGGVKRVDDDELDEAVEAGLLSEELADRARQVAASLVNAL